jgi:hypothetical protein
VGLNKPKNWRFDHRDVDEIIGKLPAAPGDPGDIRRPKTTCELLKTIRIGFLCGNTYTNINNHKQS